LRACASLFMVRSPIIARSNSAERAKRLRHKPAKRRGGVDCLGQ
jgi:hypothetical protein